MGLRVGRNFRALYFFCFVYSLIYFLIDSLTYSLTYSLIYSLTFTKHKGIQLFEYSPNHFPQFFFIGQEEFVF